MKNKYYKRNKGRFRKEANERYQNFSKKSKNKRPKKV